MIEFLKKHFVSRNGYEYRIEKIYHALEKHVETIAALQHQIDQLSAAVIELRKDKLVVKDGKLQRWIPEVDKQEQSRAKRTAAKKATTKPKGKQ